MSQQASVSRNVNKMDVRELMQEPSGKVRGVVAGKIAKDYRAGNFNTGEMEIANDIFRILLKDIDKKVRLALAEELSHIPNIPKDIILRLASDEVDVAVHALQFSRVLDDNDLLGIINSSEEVSRLRAIARRDNLSAMLSTSLAATNHLSVLGDLFANKTAILPDQAILSSWPQIAEHESLAQTLVERGGLSLIVVEKLMSAVSDDLKHRLVKEYKVAAPLANKLSADAREWELLGISSAAAVDMSDDDQIEDLVVHLSVSGRLTHSLVIRALCVGSLGLFEVGLAHLAGVPRVNVRLLLSDAGFLGFTSIYRAAHMPPGFEKAVQTLLNISVEEAARGYRRPEEFRKAVMDRIYSGGYHRTIENMPYLLSIMGGKIAQ